MLQPSLPCFLSHFSALRDPRQAEKVVYPLSEILLLMLCATVAGADDFVEIRLWGTEHQAFLRRFLAYERGIPSHDTLCDVIPAAVGDDRSQKGKTRALPWTRQRPRAFGNPSISNDTRSRGSAPGGVRGSAPCLPWSGHSFRRLV